MDSNEMYELHCKGEFAHHRESIKDMKGDMNIGFEKIDVMIEKVDAVIFGNGTEGLVVTQTKMQKDIDGLIGKAKWFIATATVLFTTVGAKIIWEIITHVQAKP
jgi:acyl-CoA hydrolase